MFIIFQNSVLKLPPRLSEEPQHSISILRLRQNFRNTQRFDQHSGLWAQVVSDRAPHPVSLARRPAGLCSRSNSFGQSWKELSLCQFSPFHEGVTHCGGHARISGLEERAIRPGLDPGATCLSLEWYHWLVFLCRFKARSLDLLLGAWRCSLFCSLYACWKSQRLLLIRSVRSECAPELI